MVLDDLISIKEIIELTGASRTQILHVLSVDDAPHVVAILSRTHYWYRDQILEWLEGDPFSRDRRIPEKQRTSTLDNELARQFLTRRC